jgi:hypothetical protein
MAASRADTPRAAAAFPDRAPGPAPPRHAALGPTIALTVTLAIASFPLVAAAVHGLLPPTSIPPPFTGVVHQDAESALYLGYFAMILPLALIFVPRLADALSAGPNGAGLSFLSGALAAGFAASMLIARLLPGGTVAVAVGVVGAWWIVAVALLARAGTARPWDPLLRVARFDAAAWAAAGALVVCSLLVFTTPRSISPLGLALGALAVCGVLAIYARREALLPAIPRPWGIAVDGAMIVLCLLAIPDLVIFNPDAALAGDPVAAVNDQLIQYHQNFLLGPANVVLHGGAMLVDTASQYGVGSIYLLVGWFQLAPIGYGTFGFLDGALFAVFFASAYAVLRLARTPRLLAAGALALAVVLLVYNLVYSVGSLPQHGPLRFGLPMLVILAAIGEARRPSRSGVALACEVFIVGLSSVWALEALAYTLFTFVAITWFAAWTRAGHGRRRWFVRRIGLAVASCVAVQLIFAGLTLAAAGHLPEWGQYFDFLQAFLFGRLGDYTYDFSFWSAGYPVGAAYLALAAAFVLTIRRRPDLVAKERAALTALCGVTAFGVVLFSYFVDRSIDHVLPYVCLPLLIAATLWLGLLLRGVIGASRRAQLGGLALALSLGAFLVSIAWSSVGERFSHTALADAAPGGQSVTGALHRLWHPPPLNARAPEGEALLDRYMPGQDHVPIIVPPDLETEILLRSGRANALALGFAREDSFAPSRRLPGLRQSVSELEPGERLLLDDSSLRVFDAYRAHPSSDPYANPAAPKLYGTLSPLQESALQQIGERFDLRIIRRDKGFVVAALRPRSGSQGT